MATITDTCTNYVMMVREPQDTFRYSERLYPTYDDARLDSPCLPEPQWGYYLVAKLTTTATIVY